MERIELQALDALFEGVAQIMAENAERLCEMDARMGDGDLGLTMKKGFGALPGLIREIDEPDLGKRLAKAGLKMGSVVPSTMGTLMSSAVLEGGKRLSGCAAIDAKALAAFLGGCAAGIQKRGKCQRGPIAPCSMRSRPLRKRRKARPLRRAQASKASSMPPSRARARAWKPRAR